MTSRTALVSTAVAALLAALAPAVSAKTTRINTERDAVGGPVLAGGRVLWTQGGSTVQVKRSLPGREPQVLLERSFDTYDDDDTGEFSGGGAAGFAASADYALLDTLASSGSSKYSQYQYAAKNEAVPTMGGTAKVLSSCSVHIDNFGGGGGPNAPTAPDPRSAIAGSVAVVAGCGPVVVRDLASGQVLRTLTALGSAPRIAGRYVASAFYGKVVVYDWQADQTAYEIPASSGVAFDLEPDGSVTTAQFGGAPSCAKGVLRFHSPANPAGVESAVKPCEAVVAVDGGKAAVVTTAQAPDRGAVIAAVGADGSRTDLARLGSSGLRTGALDYAGGTVAYAMKTCAERVRILRSSAPLDRAERTDCLDLHIKRARISGGRLLVTGTMAPGFSGRLKLDYLGKLDSEFDRTFRAKGGRFSFSSALPPRSISRIGFVSVRFEGDATYERDSELESVIAPR